MVATQGETEYLQMKTNQSRTKNRGESTSRSLIVEAGSAHHEKRHSSPKGGNHKNLAGHYRSQSNSAVAHLDGVNTGGGHHAVNHHQSVLKNGFSLNSRRISSPGLL